MKGLAAAPLNKYKELWSPTKPPQPASHTPRRPMPGTFRDSGLSSLKSEGVQEDDKTSSVLSTGTSPEHSRAWLTQNLGLPTEEVSTVGVHYSPRTWKTTCTLHKSCETTT
ncbi:hypothetical protein Taro_041685 [Colocasia esculenta]|uniref:Uncharacterized protein n=1 Tax=Colocasia esculenta TaxID=4460 RepID=A0A843WWJ1_COLES|nr:hypothetical protein [Colocasia esculenta]